MEYAKKKCLPAQCFNCQNCDACKKKGSYVCPQSRNHFGGWGWFPPQGAVINLNAAIRIVRGTATTILIYNIVNHCGNLKNL